MPIKRNWLRYMLLHEQILVTSMSYRQQFYKLLQTEGCLEITWIKELPYINNSPCYFWFHFIVTKMLPKVKENNHLITGLCSKGFSAVANFCQKRWRFTSNFLVIGDQWYWAAHDAVHHWKTGMNVFPCTQTSFYTSSLTSCLSKYYNSFQRLRPG